MIKKKVKNKIPVMFNEKVNKTGKKMIKIVK